MVQKYDFVTEFSDLQDFLAEEEKLYVKSEFNFNMFATQSLTSTNLRRVV